MRNALGVIAIAASLSACNSSGLPALGPSQQFAYPTIERSALPPVPAVPAAAPVQASSAIPTSVLAPVPAPQVAAPTVAAERPAVYDERKDPYVTAVLLPPVQAEPFPDNVIGPDGKRASLPQPAKIGIINVTENMKVLTSANP